MDNVIKTLEELLRIDSPSGYTGDVIKYIRDFFKDTPLHIKRTNKGALLVSFVDEPKLVIAGHIDTLGGMVKEVKGDGTLKITQIGGYHLSAFEGEYVNVRGYDGKLHTGTLLLNNPADHVNKNFGSTKREPDNMSIRLDELVKSKDDTEKLGIGVGCYVFYETKFQITDSGFVKSKFLDNKACSAIMVEVIKDLLKEKSNPDIGFYFSNYEEVGHGASSGIPSSTEELLVLDMAVVGDGCNGREDAVSICAKDSTGPYDFDMTEKLIRIAKDNKLDFEIDVYPYYGSDGSAARSAGLDARVGLIGPGVSASHGIERTHEKGLEATYKLTKLFINSINQ